MTVETIEANCNRLGNFYGMPVFCLPQKEKEKELQSIDLLNWYSRCLDVNGCPAIGLSLLYIPDEKEYEEMKEFCQLNFKETFSKIKQMEFSEEEKAELKKLQAQVLPPRGFQFQHFGYYWEVKRY